MLSPLTASDENRPAALLATAERAVRSVRSSAGCPGPPRPPASRHCPEHVAIGSRAFVGLCDCVSSELIVPSVQRSLDTQEGCQISTGLISLHHGTIGTPSVSTGAHTRHRHTHHTQAHTHHAQEHTHQAQAHTHHAQGHTHHAQAHTHHAQAHTHHAQAHTPHTGTHARRRLNVIRKEGPHRGEEPTNGLVY